MQRVGGAPSVAPPTIRHRSEIMMQGHGMMTGGMVLVTILLVVLAVLGIFALVKYLRS